MHKIFYDIKSTSASTNYMNILQEDQDFLIKSIVSMQSYMNELSICGDKDVRDLYKWYIQPNKKLPFHTKWKKHNSPQSFIGGTLNNIMFGEQRDLTEIQALHLQEILNMYSDLTQALQDVEIKLQKNYSQDSILFAENLWVSK